MLNGNSTTKTRLWRWLFLGWLLVMLQACGIGPQQNPPETALPAPVTLPPATDLPTKSPSATPTSTATMVPATATSTATIEPTQDLRAPVFYPDNHGYVIRVDIDKWEILSGTPDRSVYNNMFLTHRTIPDCQIGMIPAAGFEGGLPNQPYIEIIGGKNWEVTLFGHYLISNDMINFSIRSPYENESQAQVCNQDGYEILASLTFVDGSEIIETPLPTYTPDASIVGWFPCGDSYPISYLEPDTYAYISTADPSKQRIRAGSGTDQEVIGFADPGDRLTILGTEPQCEAGWVWWEVLVESSGLLGWTAEGDGNEQWVQS